MKKADCFQEFTPPVEAQILGNFDLIGGHFLGALYRQSWLRSSLERQIRFFLEERAESEAFAPVQECSSLKEPGAELGHWPVVFRGAASNWRSTQLWSDEYLIKNTVDGPVLFIDPAGISRKKLKGPFKLESLHKFLSNSGERDYLRFSPVARENEALLKDIDWNWLNQWIDGGARGVQLFMGRKGDGTLLHNDQPNNLTIQVRGRKKWRIYHPAWACLFSPPPDRTVYLRSHIDAFDPNIEEFSRANGLKGWEVTLNEGDILYNPPFFWHQVENLEDSLSLSCQWTNISKSMRLSGTQLLLRLFSMNPPIWKTLKYSKRDVNLIFAHFSGQLKSIEKLWRNN